MENPPFEGVFPIQDGDIHGYSIAMLVYRRVVGLNGAENGSRDGG